MLWGNVVIKKSVFVVLNTLSMSSKKEKLINWKMLPVDPAKSHFDTNTDLV